MNPTAIYSKSGKGVQEASGKTSLLKRPDRAVLSAIDGRATLADVAQKVGRSYDPSFQALITQLDKDGFIREVTAGAASAPLSSPPSRPAPPKPAAKPMDPASDLDFSSLGASRPASPPSRPAAPPPAPKPPSPQQAQQAKAQVSALDKAREEAEAKAAADRERVKREAEEKAKSEIESKMRADAEKRMKDEAEARAKAAASAEAEAKIRAAREAAVRAAAEAKAKAEAEAKAKLEVERKAREEAERARREAEEKARREAEELRQKLEAERRAREEVERKAREEAERLRREAEEHARKVREEAERKAREQEEKAREQAERMRRELEAERQRLEEERRKEEEERAARRKQRDEEERREDEERAARRRQKDEEEQRQRQDAAPPPPPPPPEAPKAPAKGGSFADSLLADLDSFTNKDEEEQKARQDSERKAKAEAEQRRRDEAERAEREAAEREFEARRKEEEEARRREEERRRAREEEERIAREEERRKREAEEIQRKAEAATAAAMAKQDAAGDGDIPISDEDLDLDEVKQERKALGIDEKQEKQKAKEAEREAKRKRRAEEKKQREAEKRAAKSAAPAGMRARRSSSWGRPVALFLVVVLLAAIGAAHVVPLDVTPYEKAATEALGQQVRIGSARLWLFTGVQVRFGGVRVGDARIGRVVTHPALGSLFGEQKHFSSIELEGVTLPQAAFGEALFSRVKSERFSAEQIVVRGLELQGGLALPKLDVDVALNSGGAVSSATLRGPDGLNARIVPKGDTLELEATAAGFPLPIGPDVTLSQFAMKGTATRQGMNVAEWGGAIFNGAISGTARIHWGSTWEVDGVVTVRGINAAVFAPALLSQGNADGTGRFSMSGAEPAKLLGSSRLEGRFSIGQGTLGSFDLSRAIQSRGKTVTGTTQFAELNGQVSYDRGTVALRNVTIGAGALNAGASADISKGGALSGRIIADVKTAAQTLSATLNLGGTVKEPQVRD
jgi:hypothetical protein